VNFPLHQERAFGSIKVSVDYIAQEPEDRVKSSKSRVKSEGICEFRVTAVTGEDIATGQDEYVMPFQHADVDGDGIPELIVKQSRAAQLGAQPSTSFKVNRLAFWVLSKAAKACRSPTRSIMAILLSRLTTASTCPKRSATPVNQTFRVLPIREWKAE